MKLVTTCMGYLFFTWACYLGVSSVNAQILGYPLPGDTEYPDADGRRTDRLILENDRAFNVVVSDESADCVFLASKTLDIPYLIRFDMNAHVKTGSFILDNGLSSILCAWADPARREIWLGITNYIVIIDSDLLKVKHFLPLLNHRIEKIVFDDVSGRLLCLVNGESNGIVEIDPSTRSMTHHTVSGSLGPFLDLLLSPDAQVLYVMTASTPTKVLALETNDFAVNHLCDLPEMIPATAMALNSVRGEIYIATPCTPAKIFRLNLPDLDLNGSITLPPDERPRNFMVCDESGNYLFVNDSDNSSGMIRINTYLFQRDSRINYGDLHYPTCLTRYGDSLLIATENAPGSIITVDPLLFQLSDQHVFGDNAGNATGIVSGLSDDQIALSVTNNGCARMALFDPDADSFQTLSDLPEISGQLTMGTNPGLSFISYWIEEGSEPHLVAVNMESGLMLNRHAVPEGVTCKGLLYIESLDGLLLLSEDHLYQMNPTDLTVMDSVILETQALPVRGFSFDAVNNRVLVGGGINTQKFWQYSVSPLNLAGIIELEGTEKHVVLMDSSYTDGVTYMAVSDSPYKIKRFDHVSQTFTGTANLPFTGNNLRAISFQAGTGQLFVLDKETPTTVYRLDDDNFEWLLPLTMKSGEYIESCTSVETIPYSFLALAGSHATVARIGLTQAHTIHGSWATLHESARMDALNFYSHEEGSRIRLALFDDRKELLWESQEIENLVRDGWLRIEIDQGDPQELELAPGQYLLTFQISNHSRAPGATLSSDGSGIDSAWRFGEFPPLMVLNDQTDTLWSLYADYFSTAVSPTPSETVTPSPFPTDTPQMTSTPTATSPTTTPSPTPVPSSSPTPRPGSGVELQLSAQTFHPGDQFILDARYANTDPSPTDVRLYIILDVFGDYWFAPSWNPGEDSYLCPGLIGVKMLNVFHFEWPQIESSADGLRFWGAMIEKEESEIFGYYDCVEFGYQQLPETPGPTGTNTATPGWTPEPTSPTQTPTDIPGTIVINYPDNDPMTYSGEYCESGTIFCFAPERLDFCSDWQQVMLLTNDGLSPVQVTVCLEGTGSSNFRIQHSVINIEPALSAAVAVKFCPDSPPDQLKHARVKVEWLQNSATIDVKGWCVAG